MEILSLGEKIKRRRKKLNMTLKDLAGNRITPGQISLVESGKSNPSMDLLEYLAEALHTSIEYLMESEETQAEKICTYFENIAESYILNESLNQAEKYIEKSLYYAEKYNLEYRKAKNLYLRGIISMYKDEKALAQQFFLSANVIFIKNNNYEEIVNCFVNLGKITLTLKAYHSSCSYFGQAEEVYSENEIGDDFLLGKIYYYRAFTYFKLEELDKSIDYSYLAKEKFRQLDSKKEYANSLLLMAEQYSKKGDMDNAIKYSKKTLEVFQEINDISYVSEIENNLGKLFSEFENLDESFIHLNKAKAIREKNKDAKIVDTLTNICENYIKLKNIEKCREILDEIENIVQDKSDKELIKYYLLKYRVDILDEKLREAENTLLVALNFVKNMDYMKEVAEISIMLGKFYIDNGNEKEAAKYLNEGVDMFKQLGVLKES
ncbi:anaerobic benzoate catabolism transcriptional regulator [Clostridium acetireducens DSM 10703]|uniref:Anaerobic benzoate catabolism transcriptional regulator n=1 Tax=Clostridium acetireducens DSM 10703 TaxID=1121290 RepID=A0A1E8EVJ4_9CLOT|nr:helix-turn-helix transcriptional regulator [Clostridium acetireducens]OFI00004.1 anaerobic benzoate catabolism transcriptional regulator [Clostridium acetireducens DSM 10703]